MPKKPQSGAQTAAQQQGSFLDSMPKKPQVRATNHAHAAGGKGVAWDVEDPSQGHREGLDWDNYVATSVERNTYEFNLFLVGSAVWLSVLSKYELDGSEAGTVATTKATAWRFLPLSRPTQPIDHF
ncbi:hypothetical protein NQZ68_040776 [Dissostichus eleginoides]|nr:hypothetical protein NQZ68_040776 [Dissostichus eleginoides]